jgi:hypothetical protein
VGRNLAGSLTALVAGLALVHCHHRHHQSARNFQRPTLLVAGPAAGSQPLYLKQLAWATRFQRYESSLPDSGNSARCCMPIWWVGSLVAASGQRSSVSYGHFAPASGAAAIAEWPVTCGTSSTA